MKKMKSIAIALLAVALAFTATACGQSKNSDNNADNGTSQGKTFTLKANSPAPKNAGHSNGFDAYLDEIEKRTEGRVKFERFYGGSLVKPGDELDAISTGIVDVAIFVPSYFPGRLPLASIGTNPSLWVDSWVGAKAFNELYQTVPEMQQELEKENVKFAGQYALTTGYVVTSKPVTKLSDLKGLKVVANGSLAPLAQELGANPVSMPVEDTFEAMSRGVIDGIFYGLVETQTFGLVDAVNYLYRLPVGSSAGIIGMNLDTWKKLPEDIQQIIQEVASDYHPKAYHEAYQVAAGGAALKALEDKGVTITDPTEEELAQLKVAGEKILNNWIADKESKGLPGQKAADTFLKAIEKYNEENPFAQQ